MVIITPLLTSKKATYIGVQEPQETLLPVPQTLPTTEPVTPQVSYTVASVDLPSIVPIAYQKIWVACVIGAGRFVTAGILSWRMKKNGVSVNLGTASITAGNYYTVQAWFYDVKVGNVLEIALWSSVTDSNYDYKAYQIQPSRLLSFPPKWVLKPLNFLDVEELPLLVLGNPAVDMRRRYTVFHLDIFSIEKDTIFYAEAMYPKDVYGMYALNRGDQYTKDTALVKQHALRRPFYDCNYIPTQITFRGVRVE